MTPGPQPADPSRLTVADPGRAFAARTLDVVSAGDLALVTIVGNVAEESAGDLRDALDAAFDSGAREVIIDLSAVPVIEAPGVEVIAEASCYAHFMGGRLVVAGVPPGVVKNLLTAAEIRALADSLAMHLRGIDV